MISPTMSTRIALVLASFGVSLATLAPLPANAHTDASRRRLLMMGYLISSEASRERRHAEKDWSR